MGSDVYGVTADLGDRLWLNQRHFPPFGCAKLRDCGGIDRNRTETVRGLVVSNGRGGCERSIVVGAGVSDG